MMLQTFIRLLTDDERSKISERIEAYTGPLQSGILDNYTDSDLLRIFDAILYPWTEAECEKDNILLSDIKAKIYNLHVQRLSKALNVTVDDLKPLAYDVIIRAHNALFPV